MTIAAKVVGGLSTPRVERATVRRSSPANVARVILACGLLTVSAVVVPSAPHAGAAPAADPTKVNLVSNGSFETGGVTLTPWTFRHDVASTLVVEGTNVVDGTRAAKVTISATSPSTYRVQLRQENIHLQGGTTYTLAFSAKASASRVINARIQESVAPYKSFIAKDFTLIAAWQRFTFTYTAAAEVANAFVGFNLAQATGDIEIDKVSLTGNNLVTNGGFETGGAALAPWIWRNDIDATLTRDTTTVFDGTTSAKITVPTLGSAAHQVQLRQPVAASVAGASYRVSFAIKASRARTANVRMQGSDAPFSTVVAKNFAVTTAWTRVSFDWAPTVTVTNPFLGFNLAQDRGTVWLDDVTLTPTQVPDYPVITTYQIFPGGATGGLVFDSSGNLYVSDYFKQVVWKVTPTKVVSIVAGGGTGGDGGPATAASLAIPLGLAIDSAGNLYIADRDHSSVRKVSPSGTITTAVGGLPNVQGVAFDTAGNLFITASEVYKLSPSGTLTRVAGGGTGGDGGPAINASLNYPSGLTVTADGSLYIAEQLGLRLRKVSPLGQISTVAGNGAQDPFGDGVAATGVGLRRPTDVKFDGAGNMYITEFGRNMVRKVTPPGTITTVAGNGAEGLSGDGGPATQAALFFPMAMAFDAAGNMYIADSGNHRVRKVTFPIGV